MRTRIFRILPLLLVLAGAGCARNTAGIDSSITAWADGGDIVVKNHTTRPVYYMAVDQELLAVMLWAPCDDPETCESIPAGGAVRIPRTEIGGVRAETRVVAVHAWHLVPEGAGYAVVMVGGAQVEL
ncbi:MAG TPA: hypothetical protein VFQ45_15070 [Longimicrobium sp.]|nr:hypothetical protein [Longimicrobium sp.]